jgi:hypothetical protein
MLPENGKFTYINHVTLSTTPATIPLETTHCVYGTTTYTDEYGILAIQFDGSTTVKVSVPLGEFVRLGNIIPNTSKVLTNASAPASTVTAVTFFKWEQS